jgi:hypothetical protein
MISTEIIPKKRIKCPANIKKQRDEMLNCVEDMFTVQINNFKEAFFPTYGNYKIIIYLMSALHTIGGMYGIIGLFLNPKYLLYYCIYITIILVMLISHNHNCYLTIVKSYFTGSQLHPLHIKPDTTYKFLIFLIVLGIIGYTFPECSMNSVANNILQFLFIHSAFISKGALLTIIISLFLYVIFQFTVYMKGGYQKEKKFIVI